MLRSCLKELTTTAYYRLGSKKIYSPLADSQLLPVQPFNFKQILGPHRLCSTTDTDLKIEPSRLDDGKRRAENFSDVNPINDLSSGLVFDHSSQNMYVCWHPEVSFPYEMTKPIDLAAPTTDSNLKIQALTPVREAFRRKHEKLMVQELVKLTYSTKHRFYGPFGKRKRLVFREMDPNKQRRNREFL